MKLSDNNASAGETVTATVKPDNGYGVAAVIVTDAKGSIIPVINLGNGEYSFMMPDGKVSIQTICKPAITLTVDKQMVKDRGSEVDNMLTAEWDWEVAERIWREEEREEGRQEGLFCSVKTLMETMKITAEQAMDLLKVAESDREKFRCS